MSLLVKAIALFVGAMLLFRLANAWMRSRLDPQRAVQRAASRRPAAPPAPAPAQAEAVKQTRPPQADEEEPTASLTFNLPAASGSTPPPAPEPIESPSVSLTFNLPPARTLPPESEDPDEEERSTDAATWTPAKVSQSAGGSAERVPSLDSMELVPSAVPVGPYARKAADPVDPILAQMRSSSPAVRRSGLDALHEQRASMSREQAHRLLWAAGGELPEVDDDETPVAEAILVAAEPWVSEDDVDLLKSVYPRLPNGARSQALTLLSSIGTSEAARAWTECLLRHGGGSRLGSRQSRPWSDALQHGEVFFPTLLEADLPARALEEVLLLALHYLEGDAFPEAGRDALEHAVVELWDETHDELVNALDGPAWGWTERAKSLRRRAGILLDLMGHLGDDATGSSLDQAVALTDPRVRLFAIKSSLRRGRDVTADNVAPVADAPETRRSLYDFLKTVKKVSLMARATRTQKAMAESDLARWLAFPSELGHPPDAIEAVGLVTIEDTEHGKVDWHVLRFRSGAEAWADTGWMQGVSGPWVRKDGPAGSPRGDTSSSYAAWQELDDDALQAALKEYTDGWASGSLEP